MPFVNGTFSLPPGTHGEPNTKIKSAKFNSFADDVAAAINKLGKLEYDNVFQAAVTVQGAFTSRGIDDNATGERLELSDTAVNWGSNTAASAWSQFRGISTGTMQISGGSTGGLGGVIILYGEDHATLPRRVGLYHNTDTAAYILDPGQHSWFINGVAEIIMTGTEFSPAITDGIALGSGARRWSDAFFESGAVLNFNNGNFTLTHGSGSLTASGSLQSGAMNTTGASNGILIAGVSSVIQSSTTLTTSVFHQRYYNPNGQVGSISTTGTTTSFSTSSDETLKEFHGVYSAEEAFDIILADPVRRFSWRSDGSEAVGWGAQTSHAVSPDLAVPGGWMHPMTGQSCVEGSTFWIDQMTGADAEPHSENAVEMPANYAPWGIDQGKRTPYLWAAVSGLLREIANLKTRIEELEAR